MNKGLNCRLMQKNPFKAFGILIKFFARCKIDFSTFLEC